MLSVLKLLLISTSLVAGIVETTDVPSTSPSSFGPRLITFVGFPNGGTAEIDNGPANLREASTVELSPGDTMNWRVKVNGYTGPWFISRVPNIDSHTFDVSSGFAEITIITPNQFAKIQMKKVTGLLSNGDSISLPTGYNNVEYRGFVSTLKGPWNKYDVHRDQAIAILDTSNVFTTLTIGIPNEAAVAAGGLVEFRKIFDENDGYRIRMGDGDTLLYPRGVSAFEYRIAINGNAGPWEDVDVSSAVLDTVGMFVTVVVEIPQDAIVAGAIVKLKKVLDHNNEDREFGHGDNVILPARDSVDWRVVVNGIAGAWTTFRTRTKPVFNLDIIDGLHEVQFLGLSAATATDEAPPSIEIKKVASYVTLDTASTPFVVPIDTVISWRARVNGYKGPWTNYQVGGFSSGKQAINVGGAFCLMTTNTNEDVLNFVGEVAPKEVVNGAKLHLLAGTNVDYKLQGISGQATFSVPDSIYCPATLDAGSVGEGETQVRRLLRRSD